MDERTKDREEGKERKEKGGKERKQREGERRKVAKEGKEEKG
jgi:hypothetical protein